MPALNSRSLTGQERTFGHDEIIVSKTDVKGHITYANRVFCRVAQYTEAELLGKPHNIIRHPEMPRSVFKLLWDTLFAGREIFAYVLNRSKSGDHYWVFAHVTPTFDSDSRIVGFHSNRRRPEPRAVRKAKSIYDAVNEVERRFSNPKEATAAGFAMLVNLLAKQKVTYDELVFSL